MQNYIITVPFCRLTRYGSSLMPLYKSSSGPDTVNQSPVTIVFLCSGNIIRSAYAELVFDKMISEDDCLRDQIRVRSGAVKYYNRRIFSGIVPFLIQEGIDRSRITDFRPHHINDYPELLTEANLIFVMTKSQLNLIPIKYRDKTHLLFQYVFSEPLEVPDPFFDPPIERSVNLLKKALVGLLEQLRSKLCLTDD